jgi:hypothetical protein
VVALSHGAISTTANNQNGITLGSIGGNGGRGGNSFGNIPGYAGGAAGSGGVISLVNAPTVTTSGGRSHAIFVYSRSGVAGQGGTGYIFAGGGAGGAARNGGPVTITNNGSLQTLGIESHGIYGLSVGGAAGSGGQAGGSSAAAAA